MASAAADTADSGWESIYEELQDTAKGMAPGRFLHAPEFSLRRSLTAIELMVPKMDPALHNHEKPSLEHAIKSGSLPLDPTAEQIIAILDELLIYERQWLAGATAPSSIFSCLYLHDLSKLQKEDFATIMSCILQTYFIIHRTVVDASCAHEEDFNPQLFGFSLGPSQRSNKEIALNLLILEKKLQDQIFEESEGKIVCTSYGLKPQNSAASDGNVKAGRSGGSKKRRNRKGGGSSAKRRVQPPSAISDLSPSLQLKFGLWLRVRVRRLSFLITAQLSQKGCSSFHPARVALSQLLPMMPLLQESVQLSADLPAPGFADCSAYGYDGLPHRNPQDFTRITAVKDFQAMLKHQEALVEFEMRRGLDEKLALCDIIQSDWSSPLNITVLSQLSMTMADEASFLGEAPLTELIRDWIKGFAPRVAPHLQNPITDSFIKRCAMALDFSIKNHAMNRGRFRARIPHILQDFEVLHHEAMEYDAWIARQTPQNPIPVQLLTSWIYDVTLSLITTYVLISLEHELYHVRELPYVFWILVGLYENRHLNRSSHQPSRRTRSDGSWLLAMETGFRLLCRSMVHALFALYAHGSFRAVMPDQGFGSLELMYSHRFEPMRRSRSVPLPTFQEFAQDRDELGKKKPGEVLELARTECSEACNHLRAALGHRKSPPGFVKLYIQHVLNAAEANETSLSEVIHKIKQEKKKPGRTELRIHADFKHSRQFPVISVAPVQCGKQEKKEER